MTPPLASYMITAGHVFDRQAVPAQHVWAGVAAGAIDLGKVRTDLTSVYVPPGSRCLRDVGVVQLMSSPTARPQVMDCPPWSRIQAIVTLDTIRRRVNESRPLRCKICGAVSQPFASLETYRPDPITFGDGVGTYAPVMVFYRTLLGEPSLIEGDSGAPIVDADTGALIGIHVVATDADFTAAGRPADQGWGILAESILDTLQESLGPLELL